MPLLKHQNYYEYIENVVNKCSHEYVILDRKDFRNWKLNKIDGVPGTLPTGELVKITPARCKSYSCEICGRKKVLDLMDRLIQVDLKGYRFFTLTLKNAFSIEDTEKNLQRIAECFNKLNLRLRKIKQFKNLEYFRVVEVGNNGMVHIHGIWNKYIETKLLSSLWFKVTKDSYRVDLKRIKSKSDTVNYLFKYLTKTCLASYAEHDPQLFELDLINTAKLFYENGKRRYSASRKFFSKIKKRETDWIPYGFESYNQDGVESEIKFIVKEYKLKRKHFDFELYNETMEFINNNFNDSS